MLLKCVFLHVKKHDHKITFRKAVDKYRLCETTLCFQIKDI